jgi:glycerol-3-phosphate dehydrogenase
MDEAPTAVVVASTDAAVAKRVQQVFSSRHFRVYTTDDVMGVELAGALKNVIAIAAGAVAGLGYGSNTLTALVTRGCRELRCLANAHGAKPETLAG